MTQAIRVCVIFLLLCLGRWRGDTKGQKSQNKQKSFISFMAHKQCAGYKKLLFLLRLLSFCISTPAETEFLAYIINLLILRIMMV